MGQGIQVWTKQNLWETAFEKIWSLPRQTIITSDILKAVFHKFNLVYSWMSWPKYKTLKLSKSHPENMASWTSGEKI